MQVQQPHKLQRGQQHQLGTQVTLGQQQQQGVLPCQ
jgi:hypothetical protein